MQIIKYIILFLIFIASSMLGKLLSKKHEERLEELEELKTALNFFKTKIKFTYNTIPEIFKEISENTTQNISYIFKSTIKSLKENTISKAFDKAIDDSRNTTNLTDEDVRVLKLLSKQLGNTDIEGQVSQIEITENFLDVQIKQAQEEKDKNQKLYQKLGTTVGLVIVILLV